MEGNKYPIGGYAPGNYECKCCDCNEFFTGDKRSVQCEPCAIAAKEKFDAMSPEEQNELIKRNTKAVKDMVSKWDKPDTNLAIIGHGEPKYHPSASYQTLFDYLHEEHGLTLLESEMNDLINVVNKFHPAGGEALTASDYEDLLTDHGRLVRELDVIINGDNAAPQASLVDIVCQMRDEWPKRMGAVWVRCWERKPDTHKVRFKDKHGHEFRGNYSKDTGQYWAYGFCEAINDVIEWQPQDESGTPAAAREEDAVPLTDEEIKLLEECNLYPHANGSLKVLTENDEGALIEREEIARLASLLHRYAKTEK